MGTHGGSSRDMKFKIMFSSRREAHIEFALSEHTVISYQFFSY